MAVIFVSDASHLGEPPLAIRQQAGTPNTQQSTVLGSPIASSEVSLFRVLFGRYREMYQLNSEH